MTESKFQKGDRVKLKSGSPTMTVSNASDESVECSWFADGVIKHDNFNAETLKACAVKAAGSAKAAKAAE